jgi:aspartyl/asparaginyl beta-hydroxylase (cupin superfamily)
MIRTLQAIFARNGIPYEKTFREFPVTGSILRQFLAKYSVDMPKASMELSVISRLHKSVENDSQSHVCAAGTHLKPHCGPTNHRLRLHLGLVVPEGSQMISGGETHGWSEGKVLVLDDSFEHEVDPATLF